MIGSSSPAQRSIIRQARVSCHSAIPSAPFPSCVQGTPAHPSHTHYCVNQTQWGGKEFRAFAPGYPAPCVWLERARSHAELTCSHLWQLEQLLTRPDMYGIAAEAPLAPERARTPGPEPPPSPAVLSAARRRDPGAGKAATIACRLACQVATARQADAHLR